MINDSLKKRGSTFAKQCWSFERYQKNARESILKEILELIERNEINEKYSKRQLDKVTPF